MRNPTASSKLIRLWSPLTRQLTALSSDLDPDLLTLSRDELARVRTQAHDLVQAIDTWCATHRPTPNTEGA